MREWLRENTGMALILTGVVLVLCLLIAGAAQVAFRDDTEATDAQATEQRQGIVAAQVEACEDDHEFRTQYRVRAIAEQKLLALFLDLAKQNVAVGGPDVQTSKDFIAEFTPLTERIRILPVPNCDALHEQLEP